MAAHLSSQFINHSSEHRALPSDRFLRTPSLTSLPGSCVPTRLLISSTETRSTSGLIACVGLSCPPHCHACTESPQFVNTDAMAPWAVAYSSLLIRGVCSGCHTGCLQNIWPVVYLPSCETVGSSLSSAPFSRPRKEVRRPA